MVIIKTYQTSFIFEMDRSEDLEGGGWGWGEESNRHKWVNKGIKVNDRYYSS